MRALLAANTPIEARPQANNKRLSVLDHYFLLPYISVGGTETRLDERELLRPKNQSTIEVRHDFLQVEPKAFSPTQIAVFRGAGADIVAYSSPNFRQ